MQSSQLFSVTFLDGWGVDNLLDVCAMDEPRSVVSSLETFYGFTVIVFRVQETFYCTLGRFVFECMLQVDYFLGVRQVNSIMYRHGELVPELFPVNDISIKCWDIQFRQPDSRSIGWTRRGCCSVLRLVVNSPLSLDATRENSISNADWVTESSSDSSILLANRLS